MNPRRLGGVVGTLVLLGLWELLASTVLSTADGVPTPSAVLRQAWHDGWSFYAPHIRQTGGEALTGYLVGNAAAIGCALLVLLVPVLERLVTQLAIVSYCLPIVAIGPILSLVFTGARPMQVLAGLACFFTTLIGVLLGLRSAEPAALELVRAYGGGRWQQLRRVRVISALPATLAALKIAAPAALLGAIIGEYLGRVDAGLGVAMTISEQQLEVARTWGIALCSGLLAIAGYGLIGLVARIALPWATPTTVDGAL
jgi:ABC-type nitrate/sulfonate/bicarbonate transport system permease component